MSEKIIQLMPAPKNLYAVYRDDDDPERPFYSEIVCFALTDQGDIWLMDIDDSGFIDKADTAANFIGVKKGGE